MTLCRKTIHDFPLNTVNIEFKIGHLRWSDLTDGNKSLPGLIIARERLRTIIIQSWTNRSYVRTIFLYR